MILMKFLNGKLKYVGFKTKFDYVLFSVFSRFTRQDLKSI